MKFYTLLLFCLLLPAGILAQTFEVSGTVRNREGNLVPFANVVLLQVSDTTVVKGSSADEAGRFEIRDINPEVYFIQARYFGNQSTMIPLDIRDDVMIGALMMDRENVWLDEVVVSGKQPTLERQADRLVFNVASTTIAQGSTWDILRNTPGVINVQGQLEIRGQKATIFLNDRKINLSQEELRDLLESLSGTDISAIELLPNPPARYEADGGAILNIVTDKNIVPGYKGNVRGTYTQGIFPKYSIGTSHHYKTEKINLFGSYTINPRKDFRNIESWINWIDDTDNVFARWYSNLDETVRSQSQQASLIFDYDLDARNSLNLTSNLSYSPRRNTENLVFTEMRNAQSELDSTLNTLSELDNDKLNLAVDLSYKHRFKKDGRNLNANAHFTRYDETQDQIGSSDYFDPDGNFIRNFNFSTDARQDIKIITGQVDYFDPIEKGSFEAGAKVSAIDTDSRIDYFDVNGSDPSFDIAVSDIFVYEERIYAAYANLNKKWESWSLRAGLRAEQTDVDSRSITIDSTINQDYFELFPNVYAQYRFKNNQSVAFDYNRKVTRPKYRDLNPFRYFLNENDFSEGNPNLRPHFSHNFNLNYTYKDMIFVDVYYRDHGRYISTLSFQDNVNQTLRQVRQNALSSRSWGLDFTLVKPLTPFWYFYGYTSIFHEEETFPALESVEEFATNKVDGFYAYLNNSLTLSKDGSFTGDVAFTYLTGFLQGSYKMSETINLNIGLRKSLWNNRAVVSVTAEDLLGRANALYTSRYLNQDNSYRPVPETQFIRFGLIVNFGNYGLKGGRRSLNKSERDRLDNE